MGASARNVDLEAAITADPDDEGPYLVYADWLQSHGDPRGELIVVQHALETARNKAWAKLKIRELELLTQHGDELLGPAAPRRNWGCFDWRRGFVDRMDAGWFMSDEAEYLVAHPSLAFVRALSHVELPRIHEASLPLVNELAVHKSSSPAALARRGLRALALTSEPCGDEPEESQPEVDPGTSSLETLGFSWPDDVPLGLSDCQFPNLRDVRLCYVQDDELEAFTAFLLSTPQARLDLQVIPLAHDEPVAVPHELEVLRRIRAFRLYHPDLAPLRRSLTQPGNLETLHLSGIPAWSRELVAELPIAPRLTRLVLEDGIANPDAVAALATSRCAATLQVLTLRLHDRAAVAGLKRGVFEAVQTLDVNWLDDALTASDAAMMANAFPRVEDIAIDDFRVRELSDSSLAARVRRLTLRGVHGPVRIESWFSREVEKFRSLETLRLSGDPQLTPEVFERLGVLDVKIEVAPNVGPFIDEG